MNEREFAAALKQGVKRAYYFTGNDRYVIDNCISGLGSAAGVGAEVFDAKTVPFDDIGEAVYSFSMFGENRLIVLDGFFVSALPEERLAYLEGVFPDIPDNVIIVLKAADTDEKRFSVPKRIEKLLALPRGGGQVITVMTRSGAGLTDLISTLAKREGASMNLDAARRLVELRGEETVVLDGEVKKLAARSGYGCITREMVDELCPRTAEAGVYDMLRALERGDARTSLEILSGMLRQRTEPMLIAGTLNTAFVNIARAKAVKAAGGTLKDMFSLFGYAKTDRKVEIAWKQADRYVASGIAEAVELLSGLDCDLKSSRRDRGILTETAVCGICSALVERSRI